MIVFSVHDWKTALQTVPHVIAPCWSPNVLVTSPSPCRTTTTNMHGSAHRPARSSPTSVAAAAVRSWCGTIVSAPASRRVLRLATRPRTWTSPPVRNPETTVPSSVTRRVRKLTTPRARAVNEASPASTRHDVFTRHRWPATRRVAIRIVAAQERSPSPATVPLQTRSDAGRTSYATEKSCPATAGARTSRKPAAHAGRKAGPAGDPRAEIDAVTGGLHEVQHWFLLRRRCENPAARRGRRRSRLVSCRGPPAVSRCG